MEIRFVSCRRHFGIQLKNIFRLAFATQQGPPSGFGLSLCSQQNSILEFPVPCDVKNTAFVPIFSALFSFFLWSSDFMAMFYCSLKPWGLGSLCFSRTLHITSGKHLPRSHVSNCNISFGLATECAQYNCVLAFSTIECVTFRQNYIFRSPWAIWRS